MFEQLNGKELSYNNLVDVDACVALIDEFEETSFAIIKHTNACGIATGPTVQKPTKMPSLRIQFLRSVVS